MKNNFVLFLLLISSLPSFSQVDLNKGLMAYYPFTGNANDASGNGNNPVFNNATLTNDRFGNPNSAYSFNGTDNYIQIPNSTSLNSSNQISICAWVKVTGFYQGICHGNNIVMKGNQDYQTGNYKIRFDDSYFTNSQNCSITTPDVNHESFFGINSNQSPNTFVQTNQWYSIVYTCDGTTAKIYVNCQLVGSGPANGITFTNSDDLFLGTLNTPQFPYWFNGVMDEVRIYNRAINDDEIEAYGGCSMATVSCSNWLGTPSKGSYVDIGKLDVTGNQITVEAVINRTQAYVPGGGDNTEGDIVSKHDNPTDVNYLLRPNHAYITTTKGFYPTPDIPDITLNKTYHVAMVYDGTTLKFYRDGCLMSQIAASGDLYQNPWDTRIGWYQNQLYNTNFIGYINEVRIWNVARTQAQIQANMDSPLPNPTTQPGLLAYYTFDNLANKQGNAAWNGTLGGSASINQSNTSCNDILNKCFAPPPVCNVLVTKNADTTVCANSPVNMFATGGTSFSWYPATGLSNPKLANPVAIPSATTKYYVTVTDASGCSKVDSVKIMVNNLPVISKSNDTSICISSKIPLFASGGNSYVWSPSTGLSNSNSSNPFATPLATTKYYLTVTNTAGCSKKDSVKITVNNLPVISKSNDTTICANSKISLFANGGTSYVWSPSTGLSNITSSNPFITPLVTTKYYVTVSNGGCSKKDSVKIIVNNLPVISKSNDTSVCINSLVPLFAKGGTAYSWLPSSGLDNSNIANPTATAKASTIYYVTVKNTAGCIMQDSVKIKVNDLPVISKSNDTSICINTTTALFASGGSSYSWLPATGLDNSKISNPKATPSSTTKYYVTVTNATGCIKEDSVHITVNDLPVISKSNDTSICLHTSASLFANGGTSYNWTPGSSLNDTKIAKPVASPSNSTTYTVTVTNAYGCTKTDSIRVNIKPVPVITKSSDTTICNKGSAKIFATGGHSYNWSPSATLNNASGSSAVATPDATTMYYVSITDQYSCFYKDSIKVAVRAPAIFSVSPAASVCQNNPIQLMASGGDTYFWSPALFLSGQSLKNPVATPDSSISYSVLIKENTCNDSAVLVAKITVLPNPNIQVSKSNDITCIQSSSQLFASGANQYSWTPSFDLDNASVGNPTATPESTTVYTVTGKDINGCSNSDTISVKVTFDRNMFFGLPNSFTPNGDGLNDCFGVSGWGRVSQLQFSIYNRFGQRIFHTSNPADCWDGTFQGKQQKPDVYVYMIKATLVCGKIDTKGIVTLLR